MGELCEFMHLEHRRCDNHFAAAERAVHRQDWPSAQSECRAFCETTLRHLAMEEKVLFPRFEERVGNSSGPTRVMRAEHQEIRVLLNDLEEALVAQDRNTFLGLADTLNILLQQHNIKEESILYPMAEHALSDMQDELIGEMSRVCAVT